MKVKQFVRYLLMEKTLKPVEFEACIAVSWNKSILGFNQVKLLKAANIPLSRFKSNEMICGNIVQNLKKMISIKKEMKHLGNAKGKLSPFWLGKNTTPKTDVMIGNMRISLKEKGEFQLMSGGKNEVLATASAAIDYLDEQGKAKAQDIINDIENSFRELKTDLSSKELDALANAGDESKTVRDYIGQVKDHKRLQEKLRKFFETNIEFKKWFVFEALTGQKKFSDKISSATHLASFDRQGNITLDKITPEYANTIAGNLRVQVNFKSFGKAKAKKISTLRVRYNKPKMKGEEDESGSNR